MAMTKSQRPSPLARPPQPGGETGGPASAGTQVELRKGRRLALAAEDGNPLFVVERGCLTLDAELADERRQVLMLLYPGDIISQSAAPPLRQIGLTSIVPSTVTRVRLMSNESVCAACGLLPSALPARLARLGARLGLHALAIGRLNGEERLASLLIEMATHLGTPATGGISIALPLSRSDMADYLALNPDTLSRLVSRLKARGLIATPNRSLITIRDLPAIKRLSPLADALDRMRTDAAPR